MTSLKVCLPFCAALVCSAFSTGFAAVEPVTKGYQLSPLEAYLIETFAEEQVRTFINTGNSTLFDHPKVFYVRSVSLARELKSSPKSFQKNISISLWFSIPSLTRLTVTTANAKRLSPTPIWKSPIRFPKRLIIKGLVK